MRCHLQFDVAGDHNRRQPDVERFYRDRDSMASVRDSHGRDASGNSDFPGLHPPFVLTKFRSKMQPQPAMSVRPGAGLQKSWHETVSG
jgi:hypothetical protein